MRILGIETSCDETAAAIVSSGTVVESSVITSTKDVFAGTGGVVPEDAARRQVECILPVINTALSKANCTIEKVDCIAVTKGPGLMGSLLVGTTTARTLASLWQKPLIGVHHTFGHLSSIWPDCREVPAFPCITLSVSGGHSDIWYRTSHTKGTLLGRTRDDASGEAFDKAAAMLGLPYPGGPSVSKASETGDETAYLFPLPLSKENTFDFSFSGLKTSLKTTISKCTMSNQIRSDLAASFQLAICNQLAHRVQAACNAHPNIKEVHIVGGVSANTRLRELLSSTLGGITVRAPTSLVYCTDNAAMIAAGAYFLQQEKPAEAYETFVTSATLPLSSCVS